MSKEQIRVAVAVDEGGNIVAASLMQPPISGSGAPTATGMIPSDGQVIHEVDVPEELLAKLEDVVNYRLDLSADVAKLIK